MFTKYLDPKNDLAFKKIFGEEKRKNIPIHFLNAVLHLSEGEQIEDLEFINTVQSPAIESKKESIVDVLVKDQKGNRYIVEMQVSKTPGFEKRLEKGLKKLKTERRKMIQKLLAKSFPLAEISEITGCDEKEIRSISH